MLTIFDLLAHIRLHRLLLHTKRIFLPLWSTHFILYVHMIRHALRIRVTLMILFLKLHCLLYILNLHLLEIQINIYEITDNYFMANK